MTQVDLWTLENELRTPDTEPLCGVDEAGRGPLAGPERLEKAFGEKTRGAL